MLCLFSMGILNHPAVRPEVTGGFVPFLGLDMPLLRGSILVVEDESFVREVTAQILETAGYRVEKAKNAAEAAAIFRKHEGDIALLVVDVVLPGRNGRDLVRDLARTHPELRTIFISGYPESAISNNTPLEHTSVYLAKPFSVQSLMGKVREAILLS